MSSCRNSWNHAELTIKKEPNAWNVDITERFYTMFTASRFDGTHLFYALCSEGEGLVIDTALNIGMKPIFRNANISTLVDSAFQLLLVLPKNAMKGKYLFLSFSFHFFLF